MAVSYSMHDECDGWILFEWYSWGYDCTYSHHVCFDLVRIKV